MKGGVNIKLNELFYRCLNEDYVQQDGSASYCIQIVNGTLYIFFEHSNGADDWKVNFDFPAKAYRQMERPLWFAHRGFADMWKRTEPYIAQYILDPDIKAIVIVGYSHGAAIAIMCHEYAYFNRPDIRDNIFGYGFGAPRVFWGLRNAEIMKRWENFLVIRNIDDIITHLPPSALGFSHVGNMLEIGEKGKYSKIDAHRPKNIQKELYRYEKGDT